MGRIPEFTRKRLASRVVGTAGADVSTARAIQEIGDIGVGLAGQKGREAKRESQVLQASSDKINSNNKFMDFNRGVARLASESKDEEAFNSGARELFDEFSSGIESQREKELFNGKATDLINKETNSFFDRDRKRKVSKLETNVNSMVESAAAHVADIFDHSGSNFLIDDEERFAQFDAIIDDVNDTVQEVRPFMKVENFKKFASDSAEALATAAVNSLMETAPEAVEAFLSSTVLTTEGSVLFEDMDVDALRKEANDRAQQQEELRKRAVTIDQNNNGNEMAKQFTSDVPPTYNEINNAENTEGISKKDADLMRKIKSSSKIKFLGDNAQTENSLAEEFASIDSLEAESQSFEQLSLFRQSVLEGMESGTVSRASGERWLRAISPKFDEDVETFFDSMNERQTVQTLFGFDNLWPDSTVEIVTDQNQKDEANLWLRDHLMRAIDKAENDANRRLTFPEMSAVMDTVKDSFILNNTAKASYTVGEVRMIGGSMYKVVGFNGGEPILDDDINSKTDLEK